jgi:hypothetical protein
MGDPLYLTVLVSAEKKFWRCVQSGKVPHFINAEPPRPRIEAIRIVDMSSFELVGGVRCPVLQSITSGPKAR